MMKEEEGFTGGRSLLLLEIIWHRVPFVVIVLTTVLSEATIFAQSGVVDTGFAVKIDSQVSKLAIQPDGRIVIGGFFTSVNDRPQRYIARLLADGRLDESFTTAADGPVFSMAMSSDGKITFDGDFSTINGMPRPRLARVNADGSLDSEFVPPAVTGYPGIAVQSGGSVLFGQGRSVVRLHPNGTRDTNFVVMVRQFEDVANVYVQADDFILIAGAFTQVNGHFAQNIARLMPDGRVDVSFNTSGQNLGLRIAYMVPLQNGSVYVGGAVLARLDNRGRIDPAFRILSSNIPFVYALAAQRDMKPIFGGDFDYDTFHYIARCQTNGEYDLSFNQGSGANGKVYCLGIQPDGKILIGGYFTVFNGVPQPYLVRVFNDWPTLEQNRVGGLQQRLSWPAPYSNFVLQAASTLPSTNWMTVPGTPVIVSNTCIVTNTITGDHQFFRLAKP